MKVDTQVAETILQQLGGREFAAMVGLRTVLAHPMGIQFGIGSGARDRINKVRIMLTLSDTYTVEFFRFNGITCEPVETIDEVYADMLQDVFESRTGFYCTLRARA